MKKLIIVESPSKAKTIQKYLGGEAAVMASMGHVRDLPEKSLGIDLANNFEPQYVISPGKEKLIKDLAKAVKEHDEVYLATDPDREGEAISWHLKTALGITGDKVRIEFHEISPKAVKNALAMPREINMSLVDSQQARRVLDRLVGYKISPILSKKIKSGQMAKSAGRVQSAALKMIVDREREIRAFVPEEYWNIFASLSKVSETKTFKAKFSDIGGKKFKVTCEEEAKKIENAAKQGKFYIDSIKKGESVSKPAPPFTTSTMQQEANNRLNMNSDRCMRIAQQLYEGIEVEGEGHIALITYMRTDSVRVSPEFAFSTICYIKNIYGNEYAPDKPNFYKTSDKAQDAHEAIRPISLEVTPKSLEGKIERDQLRLYKLIYERYLASQMTEARYNTMNVHIVCDDGKEQFGYTLKGKSVVFKGYTIVYEATAESDGEDETIANLPALNEGDKLKLKDIKSEQKFTKPPARYTDATLVKAMEENGIGRPSTYASIISVLAKRKYTEKEGKHILPTKIGETVCEYMEEFFPDIMNLTFTARMEGALDKIAEGGMKWQEILQGYYPVLEKRVTYARKSKYNFPVEESDVICEKCGAKMVYKEGKYGRFLACPNFPECRNVKSIVEPVGKCPKCGGDVVKKYTKSKKVFYGCSNYPACDFSSWDLPAPSLCPQCASVMKVSNARGKKYYICTNKTCGHKELVASQEPKKDNE
ncbi:MAG: type I DNA topoisomerase [Clostridiales bacterium]|nr:type I DNA topoisomerase [Clostridiales bacterium]